MFDIETYSSLQSEDNWGLLANQEMSREDLAEDDFDQVRPDPKDTIVSLTDDIIYMSVRKCCRDIDYYKFIRYVVRTILDLCAFLGLMGFIITLAKN